MSNQRLNDAIGGASNNSDWVLTLDSPFGDPENEARRPKVNELIPGLRR